MRETKMRETIYVCDECRSGDTANCRKSEVRTVGSARRGAEQVKSVCATQNIMKLYRQGRCTPPCHS